MFIVNNKEGRKKLLEVMNMLMAYILVMVSWIIYIIFKLIKMNTLNTYSFLYINHQLKWMTSSVPPEITISKGVGVVAGRELICRLMNNLLFSFSFSVGFLF